MSSTRSVPPLALERRPSRRLAAWLVFIHAGAAAVAFALPLVWWMRLGIAAAVAAGFLRAWREHVALAGTRAVRALHWDADGAWTLIDAAGRARAARLLSGVYLHPALVVLRFGLEGGGRRTVVLPGDGLDPDGHRRLRVRLRCGRAG